MRLGGEIKGLNDRSRMQVNQNAKETVTELDSVKAKFAQKDLVDEVGFAFWDRGDLEFGQLTGNESCRKKERAFGRLPRQFTALRIHDLPGGMFASQFSIRHNDNFVGSRIQARGLLDSDSPSVRR